MLMNAYRILVEQTRSAATLLGPLGAPVKRDTKWKTDQIKLVPSCAKVKQYVQE